MGVPPTPRHARSLATCSQHIDSKMYNYEYCINLDFANDIALLSDTASQAQELLENVEKAALQVGLHLNTKKIQFMAFNQPRADKKQQQQQQQQQISDNLKSLLIVFFSYYYNLN